MKTLYLLLLLSFTISEAYGQLGVYLEDVQKGIIKKTSKFDSLVLIDKAGYWKDDLQIQGFGFKDNDIFKVTILFKKRTNSYSKKVKYLKKSKLTDTKKIDSIKTSGYPKVLSFSDDSLNLMSREKIKRVVSDMPSWSILIIKQNNFIYKNSYSPELYQSIAPTTERQLFMDIINKLYRFVE